MSGKVPWTWRSRWGHQRGPGSTCPGSSPCCAPMALSTFCWAVRLWRRVLPARSHPMPPSRPMPAIMQMVVQQRVGCSTRLDSDSGFAPKWQRARIPRVGMVQGLMVFPGLLGGKWTALALLNTPAFGASQRHDSQRKAKRPEPCRLGPESQQPG